MLWQVIASRRRDLNVSLASIFFTFETIHFQTITPVEFSNQQTESPAMAITQSAPATEPIKFIESAATPVGWVEPISIGKSFFESTSVG